MEVNFGMPHDTTFFTVPAEYIDCYEHVHYTDYLKIFENARSEFLNRRGLSLTRLEQNNMRLVTRSMHIEYLNELLLDDKVTIQTSIERIGETSVIFSQWIVRGPCRDRRIDSIAFCKHVFVLIDRRSRKKMAIPAELRAMLELINIPIS